MNAGVDHYENFPVASWLCPAALRPAVVAIYRFARTADDLADEGPAEPTQRLSDLAAYRADLLACAAGGPVSPRWSGVFQPLAAQMRHHALPLRPFIDLLDAFEQDVYWTAQARRYPDDETLLDYCRRSANPVGRLMLHLYGTTDAQALAQSDCICTALQLINFWQDLSLDLPRQRVYPSLAMLQRYRLSEADLLALAQAAADGQPERATARVAHATLMMAAYADQARALMLQGAPLALRLPGRAGWELRLVVQGGLAILDKIAALRFATWARRPRLQPRDLPVLLWRALRASAQ
ncbi:MAG: squalene synthase HpnC [Rhodoferax sp.]